MHRAHNSHRNQLQQDSLYAHRTKTPTRKDWERGGAAVDQGMTHTKAVPSRSRAVNTPAWRPTEQAKIGPPVFIYDWVKGKEATATLRRWQPRLHHVSA